jgi:hypothetical protein
MKDPNKVNKVNSPIKNRYINIDTSENVSEIQLEYSPPIHHPPAIAVPSVEFWFPEELRQLRKIRKERI